MKIKGIEVSDETMHVQVVEGEALSILTSKTGAWRAMRPVLTESLPPCTVACPAGIKIRDYLSLLADEKIEAAWQLMKEDNPFPAITGRVCPAPCEINCNRGDFDESIAVKSLESLLGDYGLKQGFSVPRMPAKMERVAVVGSGPAGLSAAYYLATWGYRVTIFESLPVAGGMLYWGIPSYRLPKVILKNEIKQVMSLGVEIKTCVPIGEDLTFDALLAKDFQAVLVAIGASRDLKLNITGEDTEGVFPGVRFLQQANSGSAVDVGDRVFVIGGGNAAIDAARVCLRSGARRVSIMYRRTRAEMPAIPEEIESALEEGIEIQFCAVPVEILVRNGRAVGMRCIRVELGEPDSSGRKRPLPVAGSEFDVETDSVVVAIGQAPDLSFLGESGIETTSEGTVSIDHHTLATNLPRVFAAGDVQTGPATVAQAIANGKKAAMGILASFTGTEVEVPPRPSLVVGYGDLNTAYFKPETRRVSVGAEAQTVENAGIAEARRCFVCGKCNACNTCWFLCPDSSVLSSAEQIRFDYDYCKGCGVCAEECPRRAVLMEEESKWQ